MLDVLHGIFHIHMFSLFAHKFLCVSKRRVYQDIQLQSVNVVAALHVLSVLNHSAALR